MLRYFEISIVLTALIHWRASTNRQSYTGLEAHQVIASLQQGFNLEALCFRSKKTVLPAAIDWALPTGFIPPITTSKRLT